MTFVHELHKLVVEHRRLVDGLKFKIDNLYSTPIYTLTDQQEQEVNTKRTSEIAWHQGKLNQTIAEKNHLIQEKRLWL